jgi:hypothetical protein
MKRITIALVLAATAAPAFAQKQPAPDANSVPPAPTKHITYDDDDVIEGNGVGPDGEFIRLVHKPRMPSMLHERTDFYDAMMRSAEDL